MSTLKKMSAVMFAATAISLASVGQAQAGIIGGVNVSTDMGDYQDDPTDPIGSINSIINGTGLPGNTPALSGQHAISTINNSWASDTNKKTGVIDFYFGGNQYAIKNINVWNLSSTTTPYRAVSGVKNVEVSTSTDGVNYSIFSGITQFAAGPNPAGPINAQSFNLVTPTSLGGVLAKHVRFKVLSNYNSLIATGLSEVQFDGKLTQAIPTPALLPGLVGLGMAAARKRRAKGELVKA
jgi:hypothetical protein